MTPIKSPDGFEIRTFDCGLLWEKYCDHSSAFYFETYESFDEFEFL